MNSGGCRATLLGMAAFAGLVGPALGPVPAAAQSTGLPIEIGGLLRTGLRLEPESSPERDGFDLFDARVRLSGEIGIVFEYFLQTEFDPDDGAFRLLDAKAIIPLLPEIDLAAGLFRPSFGLEALLEKGQLTFLERAQASEAIAPGRQVGVALEGSAFDGRLTWGGGVFNGNGRRFENDGDDFMVAGRVEFNSIGTIAFYDDFVIQVGASIGRSSDTAAELGPGLVTGDPEASPELTAGFSGDRLLWGADVQLTYRDWSLTAEYLRGEFDIEAGDGAPPIETDAYGGYVELGYRAYGAIEGVLRFDGFHPAGGANRDFLIAGFNVYPGHYAKFGVQYAFDMHDSPDAPTVAGDQFILLAQVDF